jgi:hypothetical protein
MFEPCNVDASSGNGSLSESGLVHLKSYKYSSVDKSYISYYILRHYVRSSYRLPATRGVAAQRTVEEREDL